jgi:Ala-tRNA(Pro) deacylase
MRQNRGVPMTPQDLLALLDELGIASTTVTHDPVYTVAEARELRGGLPGGHCKSLFLRNKKGAMWLVVTLADRTVDLRRLGDSLGSGRLSFGSPERLLRHLGVTPGAVTPFGLANDADGLVAVALEEAMLDHDPLHFHPLDNAMTTAIGPADLIRFLEAVAHPPQLLDAGEL